MAILLTQNDDDVSYVTANDPLEIYGLGGNDKITAGNNSDFVDGGDGNDTLNDLGGLGNDHFVGGLGNDTLYAIAGNDWLEGGADNDVAQGGGGNDLLDGGSGDDALTGEADDDTLYAGTGTDFLLGGSGNDTLFADGSFANGADTLRGDEGNDVYVLGGANIVFNPSDPGLDRIEISTSFSLGNLEVEDLTLTGGADAQGIGNGLANTIIGNGAGNLLNGLGGNDLIRGYGGDDRIYGGGGPEDGTEYLYGGTGDDMFYVSDAGDRPVEFAGEGHDRVDSEIGFTLPANVEDLYLQYGNDLYGFGNGDANRIFGNSGANQLRGYGGLDTLTGYAGNDSYYLDDITLVDEQSGYEYDTVVDTSGVFDQVFVSQQGLARYYVDANIELVTVTGTLGLDVAGNDQNNTIVGNGAHNLLAGGGGNDTLDGRGGIDELAGGTGNDTYTLADTNDIDEQTGQAYDVVTEAPNEGIDTVYVYPADLSRYYLDANVENVIALGTTNLDLAGNALANTMGGNGAHNLIGGAGGDDTLDGGFGFDELVGGLDDDLYILNDTTNVGGSLLFDSVGEAAGEGADTVQVSSEVGRLTYVVDANVENALATGNAAFNLVGNGLNNNLAGNGAANVLTGGIGNDTLTGGAGADTLTGGIGNDVYVDPAGDTIVENPGEGTDLVRSSVSFSLAALPDVERIVLTGGASSNADGNAANNILVGNGGANALNGGTGNDTLDGGAGNDRLTGGTGANTLKGGDGNDLYINPVAGTDTIVEAAGAAAGTHDRVQTLSSFNLAVAPNVEDVTLAGGANVNASGNNLANILIGNGAANILNGGGGADTLTGGGGNDTMNGGAAADLFAFAAANTGADRIEGFSAAQDRFDLSGGTFSGRTESGGNTTLTHSGGTIVVAGVTGLSLGAWRALIDDGARHAPAHDAMTFGAMTFGAHIHDYF